jgi:hypothetical protein
MKKIFNFYCVLFVTLFISVKVSHAQIPIPPSQWACAICNARTQIGEAHKPGYSCYKAPVTTKPSSSNANTLQQQIVLGLFTNMFNNMLNNSNTQNKTQSEKIRQQNENRVRQHQLYLQNKYNDSVALARHKKMMGEYKLLDAGTKDLKYKGLNDQNSSWDASVVVLNEQNFLDKNTQTWVEYQKEQFKIRMEQPNYWCQKYLKNLIKQDSILNAIKDSKIDYNPFEDMYTPPKRLSEVQSGDVVLVGSGWAVDEFAHDINKGADHTLTCVKVIKGKDGKPDKRLYLDAQPGEGPKIITEEQMMARYGKRELNVAGLREEPWGIAQPLNDTEAKKLWDKALELHTNNRDKTKFKYGTDDKSDVTWNVLGTNYGLVNDDNMVCSEASWMLVNAGAEGRYQIPKSNSKLLSITGIEFSPASFYTSKQYFIITPLTVDK